MADLIEDMKRSARERFDALQFAPDITDATKDMLWESFWVGFQWGHLHGVDTVGVKVESLLKQTDPGRPLNPAPAPIKDPYVPDSYPHPVPHGQEVSDDCCGDAYLSEARDLSTMRGGA